MFDNNSKRDVIVPQGMRESEVLAQVAEEYQNGYNSVRDKRSKMKADLEKYYVAATKEDKVSVHTIYTTMQTLMSVFYNDKAVVEFEGRTSSAQSYADNLNKLVEFDYDEMGLDKVDYQWIWDSFFHGVGIKVLDGWDSVTKTPIARTISPLAWIPDPQGGFSIESHRWCGFESEVTKASLGKGFVNVDLINDKPSKEQEDIRRAYQEGRNINDLLGDVEENKKYSIYHHYTRIDGKPYLITTANNNTLIIRMIEMKPVLEEEKKDHSKIMFPVALKYYSPLQGDPFGVSVPDLLRDKQTSESKLFNLTLISATRNSLGDDKLYNPKKIKNINELKTPTIGGKYIAANVNEGESLANALLTVPKENPTSLPFNIEERISYLNQLSTGINANTLGVGGMQNMTAAEAQSIQKNANLRFNLATKVQLWGVKDFYHFYLRSYIYNLKGSEKKVFKLTSAFGANFFELKKDDFATEKDIRIKVKAKSEIDGERDKYKNDLYGLAPQILADPETPTVGKLTLKRKLYDFGTFDNEQIEQMTFNADEQNALLDVELINAGEEPQPIQEGQDHLVYMATYYQADDNEKKWEAIEARKNAYLESAQRAAQQMGQMNALAGGGGDNTQGNIAASNAASRQGAAIQNEANNIASNEA